MFALVDRADRDGSFAGRTHAPNPLPRLGFAPYITCDAAIPRGLPPSTR
jgi:hypothetical protein